ncbi:phosphoadenosine phosphosulfate reductase family protein [Acetobacter sp. TBRC 12305]|uniref:Phosphoadenosine phosphosulfate reductase family protein n=1 Tax=Acetobacter garciniae TaxID=2817435 RepID=A0A939HKX1_9PROT|nr:phosphoadenosine phosphosulfate reductase family protein [Acetobacter garciniae]MBO1325382.1 phosphoadenosine phosphosulfate reductase family protein [Acetobacter garciniae]MBX0345446.1 phosphoadenosine phosphosulfate reductase family protein [Acetobacter garciniae]
MSEQNDGRPVPTYPRVHALPVVSFSGGKDSLCTLIKALEIYGRDGIRVVTADTDNENPLTVEYINHTIPEFFGIKIDVVKADFTAQIARKRVYVETVWPTKGVPDDIIRSALATLHPTGNAFLDLCIWKGRFPSRRVQFCTQELKSRPLSDYLDNVIASTSLHVENWQGVRRDESASRANALMWEIGSTKTQAHWIHRPIIHMSALEVVAFARSRGVPLNPLYALGENRVGCFPCVNCGKAEILNLYHRWPEVIERMREWERIVSAASKRGLGTFFFINQEDGRTDAEHFEANRIDSAVEWAKTARGGTQFDLECMIPPAMCSSEYGLCE